MMGDGLDPLGTAGHAGSRVLFLEKSGKYKLMLTWSRTKGSQLDSSNNP